MKKYVVSTGTIYEESGKYLLQRVQENLQTGKNIFLQFSGGSAIQSLQPFAEWLNKFPEPLNERLVMTLIDERYNSDLYSKDSNTMQINEQVRVMIEDVHEIGLIDLIENSGGVKGYYERVNHGLPKANEVEDFDALLHKYLNDEGYQKIAIYGIGDDSHISGILPHPDDEVFFKFHFQSLNLADGYEVSDNRNPYKDRITTTFTAMEKVDEAIVVINGEIKKKALEKALSNDLEQLSSTPATILKYMKDVVVFSDN